MSSEKTLSKDTINKWQADLLEVMGLLKHQNTCRNAVNSLNEISSYLNTQLDKPLPDGTVYPIAYHNTMGCLKVGTEVGTESYSITLTFPTFKLYKDARDWIYFQEDLRHRRTPEVG
jgi:hypothetical protein